MAFMSRILSKSKQVQFCASRLILQSEYAIPVRHFAEKAARPELEGDRILKDIYLDVKKKYEAAIAVLRKEKITIDPDDPAAVSQYANVMKIVREKAGLLSEPERIRHAIDSNTQGVDNYRSYLAAAKEIWTKVDIDDDIGILPMMLDALEKVEKQLKKPLLRSDKEGMALMNLEIKKIFEKLGLQKVDLPKIKEEMELKVAKAQLVDLKKHVVDAMETQLKREEFKDEEMVDPKTLDIRNFI